MAQDRGGVHREQERPGFWRRLWHPPRSRLLLGAPVGAILALVVGIGLAAGSLTAMEATSSTEFCVSCHTMEWNYEEYKESAHFKNESGVKASCPDCHVPNEFLPKLWAKLTAARDVYHQLAGTIDTKEKYEANRERLAKKVWAQMRATNSRACRSCHSYEAMASKEQGRYARRKHSERYREATGKTCIDCHEGITHKLPEEQT